MHHLESQLLNLAPVKPYLWLRYIDDIFNLDSGGTTTSRVPSVDKSVTRQHQVYMGLVKTYH